ncbi:GIY-YIG nuclease family protein [Alteromonas sp. ASW11-36]|uniref:GIY-YIG nuclease family protein n=1 Tax=Alteromonas arenosi TaxID=3055817 RepID=A0ABT7SWJ9_9ALTE|nr:GIY-YIG nuclease family protein [Alteromonas sp. ASW11-36]MDM7860558.1 GIY-YIG nuclease family protein [Alteromonas sp. ASW11-36]
MAQNPFYVYALKDPREKPARTFYIGKGTGNRAWEHQTNVDDSEKGLVIQGIHDAGLSVLHTVIIDNLTEEQSLKIEAELIAAFGIRSQGGLLTNRVKPNPNNISKRIRVNIPDGCYEKAQMGLNILKSAVMELAKANQDGIKNSDAAKYLGLQSDYGGGSKDYLSYSILGVLMREGKIERNEKKKHVAKSE